MLHAYEEEERFQNLTSTMSEFIIKNVVTEIFSDMCNMETIVKYGEDTYVIVTRNLKENAEMVLKKLIMQCDIHLNCRMRVFYDLECPLPAVKECFERLIHIGMKISATMYRYSGRGHTKGKKIHIHSVLLENGRFI